MLHFTCTEFNATIEKNLVVSVICIRFGKRELLHSSKHHYVIIFFLLVKNYNMIIKKELKGSQFDIAIIVRKRKR